MSQDRLNENFRVYCEELDSRLGKTPKKFQPEVLRGAFYGAFGYFEHVGQLEDDGITLFARQQFMHEALIYAYKLTHRHKMHLNRAELIVLSSHRPVFRHHESAAEYMYRTLHPVRPDQRPARISDPDKMSVLTAAEAARLRHLEGLAQHQPPTGSGVFRVKPDDIQSDPVLTRALQDAIAKYHSQLQHAVGADREAIAAFVEGLFWCTASYFRFATPDHLTLFEQQLFMHQTIDYCREKSHKAKDDVWIEINGAMALIAGPVFKAYFSANQIMMLTGSGLLPPAQLKELQRVTQDYAKDLPHRITSA